MPMTRHTGPLPSPSSSLNFLLFALVKVVSLVAQLFCLLLWTLPALDVILVQTPPCLPTFAVAWVVAWLRGAAFGQ